MEGHRASTVEMRKQPITVIGNDTETATWENALAEEAVKDPYHRDGGVGCCIIPGEMDDGGLATRMPVMGLTMGIAFLVRRAEGWCILI